MKLVAAVLAAAGAAKDALPFVAIAISALGFYFTRKYWHESNRPIVVAFIETNTPGNLLRAYDLVVANSGNRPAANVRLEVENAMLEAALATGANASTVSSELFAAVLRCFTSEALIPVILPGSRTSNSFGITSNG
jgi:hypothetical protein